jgi:RimJ/RimL family protein N-acetyltransferase
MDLKELTENDLELILAWRNNPKIFQYFSQQNDLISWNDHFNWFKTRKNRKDWIIIHHDRKIGLVNLSKLNEKRPEIGIYIGEMDLWGKGLATQAVKLAIDWLKNNGYNCVIAHTQKDNIASNKLWINTGFKEINNPNKNDELLYEKIIN